MPTKIIGTPRYIHNKFGVGKIFEITCDDGKYNAGQLAKSIGIATSSLLGRAYRHGWDSPLLFAPKSSNHGRIDKESDSGPTNEGNAEWQALSRKPRDYNLRKIAQFARYDSQARVGCDNVMA